MSTKLTGGKATAGKLQQSVPGDVLSGIQFASASTSVNYTSFSFPTGSVVNDVFVKVIATAATSATISVGLATGASSAGVGNAYVNALIIGVAGTYVMNASTSAVVLAFSYGSYFVASTSASVTVLKSHVVGSTDTYLNLTYTTNTTAAITGVIYPSFHELA